MRRRDVFGHQRLMLGRIEEAGSGIAAGVLPARDRGAGLVVELAVDFGVEAETGQPALHVAAPGLVEADLVFGDLGGFLGGFRGGLRGFMAGIIGQGHRFDRCRSVAVGRAEAGFGRIRADENEEHRESENQDTHGPTFPDLEVSG